MNIIDPALDSQVPAMISKTNLLLLFNLFVVIICGLIFEQRMVLGSIVLESLILLNTLLWIGLQGMDYRETLRLKFPALKEVGATLIVVGAGIYVASFVDRLFRFCLQNWGTIIQYNIPRPQNTSQLLLMVTAIVILPALAEEVLFRGFILKNYQQYLSAGKAVFISALFFGLAHLNIQNFWGPFILGLLYGWLTCKFGSIFLGVIGHLLNNGLTIFLLYFMPNIYHQKLPTAKDLVLETPSFVIAIFILLVLLLRYRLNPQENINKPGKLSTVLHHWSTWLIMIIFGIMAVIQFMMDKV